MTAEGGPGRAEYVTTRGTHTGRPVPPDATPQYATPQLAILEGAFRADVTPCTRQTALVVSVAICRRWTGAGVSPDRPPPPPPPPRVPLPVTRRCREPRSEPGASLYIAMHSRGLSRIHYTLYTRAAAAVSGVLHGDGPADGQSKATLTVCRTAAHCRCKHDTRG